jgi:hypothetical protein
MAVEEKKLMPSLIKLEHGHVDLSHLTNARQVELSERDKILEKRNIWGNV